MTASLFDNVTGNDGALALASVVRTLPSMERLKYDLLFLLNFLSLLLGPFQLVTLVVAEFTI